MYISEELNRGIPCAVLPHRFHIACSLRMVPAGNHQLGIRQGLSYNLERVEQKFEPLVGSPLTKRQDAMLRISPPGKIGVFGSPSQDAVRPQMNVVTAIFFIKNLAVSRHQNGNRIREQ